MAENESRISWPRLAALASLGVLSAILLFFTPLRDYLEPRRLTDLLETIRSNPLAPLLFLVGFVALALIGSPLIPLMIAGGAVFGFIGGFVLNYLAVLLAIAVSFWLARFLGQDVVSRLLGSRRFLLERLLENATFWPLVRLRFLPIPFPIANYGGALLGVRFPVFLASAALAYLPIMAVYSWFAAALVQAGDSERSELLRNLTVAALAMLALTFLPPRLMAWWANRQRRTLSGSPRDREEPPPPPADR